MEIFPRLHRLQCEQQRHDLGDRRHGHLGVRLFSYRDVAGVDGNEDRVAARDIQLRFCKARVFLHRRWQWSRAGWPRPSPRRCPVVRRLRRAALFPPVRRPARILLRADPRAAPPLWPAPPGQSTKGKRGQQNDCRQPHPAFPFHHNHPPQFRGLSIIYMKHARPHAWMSALLL